MRKSLPLVVFLVLAAVSLFSPAVWAQVASPGTGVQPIDEWPRDIEVDNAIVTIYQPQLDRWGDVTVDYRAAVSVQSPKTAEPVFGAVWVTGRYDVDRDARTVRILDIKVPRVKLDGASEGNKKKLASLLETEIPTWDLVYDLDLVIPYLKLVEEQTREADGFNDRPPRVLVRHEPSVLIFVDGTPRLEKVENAPFERVSNTPYVMVKYEGTFWLATDKDWYSARNIEGPWRLQNVLPDPLKQLDKQLKEEQKKQQVQQEAAGDTGEQVPSKPAETRIPKVVVSLVPAELIFIDGKPQLKPLGETGLSEVSNTDSDVLYDNGAKQWYVLLSGRWFTSPDLDRGPWTHVASDELPAGFANIPKGSEVGYLRASVAGTEEAQEAVLEQVIPNTAAVRRDAPAPEVTYDGQPKFEPIEKTKMVYAVNTSSAVVYAAGRYYLCDQGVWYDSASPTGPWTVSITIPAEISQIPPSCPIYNVTYVKIYDTTPEVVYVGYTPGYTESFVHHGCVVYGTGHYYRPWWGPHHYYPRPVTYGFHVRWNPWYGWSFGFSFGTGPFHFTIGHGPWGGWAGFGGWFGPGFFRPYPGFAMRAGWRAGYRHGYWHGRLDGRRPRPTPYARNNIYRSQANRARIAQGAGTRTARQPRTARGKPNNIYTDRNGNVYRRTRDGSWEQRNRGSWQKTTRPAVPGRPSGSTARPSARPSTGPPTPGRQPRSLESDYRARQRGNQRIQSRPPSYSRSHSRAPRASRGGFGRRR
ncbi:MAG: hypothetical protein GXP47_12000 [Acidobacteria bacterium]|nr:hypothetical protein [Acidobacteriota bacterium]